jgi:hypothetical protein
MPYLLPRPLRPVLLAGAAALLLGACTQTPRTEVAPVEPALPAVSTVTAEGEAVVYRSETCSCCHGHVEHLEAAGWVVRDVVVADVREVKEQLGVPGPMESCHTTVVDGYFVEGHVPADVIDQLLEERPEIDGIALPGMPAGSPGMGGEQVEPFVLHAVVDGQTAVYTTR